MNLAGGPSRRWWATWRRWINVVRPGGALLAPPGELVATLLGSCVSVCLRDPVLGVGGMNHMMLPVAPDARPDAPGRLQATAYGAHAMEVLINAIMQAGGERTRLEAKVFGGGRMLRATIDIGGENVRFAKRYLALEGIPLRAIDVGGVNPRKIVFDPRSGDVKMRRLASPLGAVAARELEHAQPQPAGGDVELFR